MSFLLDTDWLIDYLAGNADARSLVASILPDGVAISVVTFMEIYDGIETSPTRSQDEREFRTALRSIAVLPVNRTVARRAARIRATLRERGGSPRRRTLDILIAATALVHSLALVTRNTGDYQGIDGLTLHR